MVNSCFWCVLYMYIRNILLCFRDVYVTTMQPQSKQVVIMMDHGNSLSQTQLHMAKSITKSLIASFSENDRVGSKIASR